MASNFAYYTYTMNINKNTGDYDYKFIAYAFNVAVLPSSRVTSYAYCAIINGEPQHPSWLNSYSYRYKLGVSYNAYFLTEYAGVQKYAYLKFQIATYWNVKKTTNNTYYSTAFSFLINESMTTTKEFVGFALFSIDSIGEFIGDESEWSKLLIPMKAYIVEKSSNLYLGYTSCTGISLYTAKIKVITTRLPPQYDSTSTISTQDVYIGASTIYVMGISRVFESKTLGTYRYSGSLVETLTESSWSTTKPSIV